MKPIFVLPSDIFIANHFFLFIVSFLIVLYFKTESNYQEILLTDQKQKLAEEKSKSDELLLNILPYETAEELKATGFTQPRYFKEVTVMFTDFHNFTQMAVQMPQEMLVEEIHLCFSSFDSITSRYGIEKIKTIGDSYMCASGLPVPKDDHAVMAICAALEIVAFIEKRKQEKLSAGQVYFEVRIGIHTGPVVAGVVGTKKFVYDIWGDTVNVASRMESCGEEGRINISQSTYERVKEKFKCLHRGKINAKNKGMVDMYFVEKIFDFSSLPVLYV
ncbi:adenylate/guanylate cyclase domain-containing protein [Flavisolibacter nicotianae]|uniref:adenylate/guanylate cyclase domain-containing protein n=1 Tax=Flavisolibacter nicotianae TaxID=2364882 RepID=UPI001F08F142|nr:adenylate/guanylate cyclase domain-containing protein [Flavisolibacter nicotianae]